MSVQVRFRLWLKNSTVIFSCSVVELIIVVYIRNRIGIRIVCQKAAQICVSSVGTVMLNIFISKDELNPFHPLVRNLLKYLHTYLFCFLFYPLRPLPSSRIKHFFCFSKNHRRIIHVDWVKLALFLLVWNSCHSLV